MNRFRAVAVIALLGLSTLPARAQQGPPPPEGPDPMHFDFVLRAIDLTPEQDARIGPLLDARHDAADANRPAAEVARRALGDQVRSATFDEAAIRAKAAAVASLEADRAVADAALLRDVRVLLTPGQRVKFDLLLEPPSPPALGGERGHRPR